MQGLSEHPRPLANDDEIYFSVGSFPRQCPGHHSYSPHIPRMQTRRRNHSPPARRRNNTCRLSVRGSGQQRKGNRSIMLQQIIAVAPTFVAAALIGGMALALPYRISARGRVGSHRRVEDRITVLTSVGTALLERGTAVVIARSGDVISMLRRVTSTSVHSKHSQAQDSGYAYNSLHDAAHLPLAKGR